MARKTPVAAEETAENPVIVYESRHAGMTISMPVDSDGRHRVPIRFDAPSKFDLGILRLTPAVLARSRTTVEEVVALIEGGADPADPRNADYLAEKSDKPAGRVFDALPDFKDAVPNVNGIWRQGRRVEEGIGKAKTQIRALLAEQPNDALRSECAQKKITIPVIEDPAKEHDILVDLIYNDMMGSDEDKGPAIVRGAQQNA